MTQKLGVIHYLSEYNIKGGIPRVYAQKINNDGI